MATLDFDVPMVPTGEPSSNVGPSSKKPKHFEIKKWNVVTLWAWGLKKIDIRNTAFLSFDSSWCYWAMVAAIVSVILLSKANGGTGLSPKEIEICDFFGGGIASLNVTVVAFIVVHHFGATSFNLPLA
ncbi:hypothetical protein JHK87_000817 [Glycine soja]|nr:hypothetical protein JHK87_000817 [Glycine soja]